MSHRACLVALVLAGVTGCASGSPSYADCAAVKAAGAAPLSADDPGYSTTLDRDGDGVACDAR